MQNETPNTGPRFLKNWFFSLLSWALPLCLAFVSTPILVRGLGTEQYGIYAVILGFLNYTFSTGIGKVGAKYIPESRAARSPAVLSDSLSAAMLLTLGIGILQAAVLAVATPYIVRDMLVISGAESEAARTALYLAALSGFILMVSQVFQFSLQGLHRFGLFAIGTNIGAALSAVGNILLVFNGFGIVALLIWNAVAVSFAAAFFAVKVKPLLPEWQPKFSISKQTFAAVARYSGSIIIYQTLTSILFIFERSWISRKFGPEAVSFYVVPMMLAIYMHGLLASFAQVLFPLVNELLNDKERLLAVYRRATRLVLLLMAFILSGYFGLGQAFLGLWINPAFAERSYALLVILGAAFAFNIMSMIVWLLAEAFRAPGLNALSSTIWTTTAIPLMIWMSEIWQSEGVALGRLIGVLFTIPLIFFIEKRFLGRRMWSLWVGLILRLIPSVAAAALAERYIVQWFSPSWASLFAGFFVGSAFFGVIVFLAGYFDPDDFAVVRPYLPFVRRQVAR